MSSKSPALLNDSESSGNCVKRNFAWYQALDKPKITPPQWVFPVVWTILYIMIGVSLYFYLRATQFQYTTPLIIFTVQLVLNLLWTPLFFCCRMITVALIDIVLLLGFIVANIIFFYPKSPLSAYLLIPYLIWVCVATYLNFYIFRHNPDPCCKK